MSMNRAQPNSTSVTSKWGALARVITDPVTTFRQLGEKPPVVPGYLLAMSVGLISTAIALPKALEVVAESLAAQGQSPQIIAIGKVSGVIGGLIGAAGGPWLAGVILAVIALFMGQFQDGGNKSFKAYLGAFGYARVPLIISMLIQSLLALLFKQTNINLSLAVLTSKEASPYLRAALGTINPFDLWYYALLAIAFATLHKKQPSKGVPFVAVVYLLTLLMALLGGASQGLVPKM